MPRPRGGQTARVTDLVWETSPPPILHRPVMVVAFAGLFDAAGVSAAALDWLVGARAIETVAGIDPDGFFDFSQHRPQVHIDEDDERIISWPENEFVVVRASGAARDLIVLNGEEPDVRWRHFAEAVLEVATTLGCETVVTVGGVPEGIPHTRTPQVFGSTTTPGLAARLGLSRPQYQGPTGVVGVIHDQLETAGIPAIALRVGVPHYLGNAKHPKSTAALLRHLEHVLGFPTRHGELAGEVERWSALHDEAIASDPRASAFVAMLEREWDRRAELSVPTADDLGAAFEEFLREARGSGDGPPEPGGPAEPDPDPGPEPDPGPGPA